MTNVITDVKTLIAMTEINNNKKRKKDTLIANVLDIREMASSEIAKELYKKYLTKINGKYIIKGTRISSEDIGRIIVEGEVKNYDDIIKEYPSLDNEEQVIAGTLMFAKRELTIWALLKKCVI